MTLLETLPESTWWVLASMLVLVATANLAVLAPRVANQPFPRALLRPTPMHIVVEFLYYVGWPYLALLAGAVAPLDLGLRGLPPIEAAERSGPFVLLMLGLLGLAWVVYRGSVASLDAAATPAWPPAVAGLRRRSATWAWQAVEAVYAEAHLAFYRAWLTQVAGLYVGAWLGFALWGIEMLALPSFWRRPHRAATWETLGMRLVFGTVTTAAFLQTRSLWFGLLVHVALRLGVATVGLLTPVAVSKPEAAEAGEGVAD